MLRRLDRGADQRPDVTRVDAPTDRSRAACAADQPVEHLVELLLAGRDVFERARLDPLEEEPVATARRGRDPDELFERCACVGLRKQLLGTNE